MDHTNNSPLSATPGAVDLKIEESYLAGKVNQWGIELLRNIEQALKRATPEWLARNNNRIPEARFDMMKVGASGAIKRVVWNTGPHMTEHELRDYFTRIGQGSGDMWSLSNLTGDRHAGARESILPFNQAGLVVISYDPIDHPSGSMVWIHRPEGGHYCLANLPTGDVSDETGEPYTDVVVNVGEDHNGFDWGSIIPEPIIKHGGVMFVLLGMDADEDDLEGIDVGKAFPTKVDKPYAFLDSMHRSFYSLDGLDVSVVLSTGEGGTIIINDTTGTPRHYVKKIVYGIDRWNTENMNTKNPKVVPHSSGTIDVPGMGFIEWRFKDAMVKKDGGNGSMPFDGKGGVAVKYRNDLMGFNRAKDVYSIMPLLGVPMSEVYNRLLVIFHPNTDKTDDWFVVQNQARSALFDSSNNGIDWEEWFDCFRSEMPEVIREAIRDTNIASNVSEDKLQAMIEKLMKRINKSFGKAVKKVENPEDSDGSKTGTKSFGTPLNGEKEEGGHHDDDPDRLPGTKKKHHVYNPGSKLPARAVRKVAPSIALCDWLSEKEWSDKQKYDPTKFVKLVHEGDKQKLYFNAGHGMYKQYLDATKKDCQESNGSRRKLTHEQIEGVIRECYWMETAARLYAFEVSLGTSRWSKAKQAIIAEDESTTIDVLTFAAHGFMNVDQAVKDRLNGMKPSAV